MLNPEDEKRINSLVRQPELADDADIRWLIGLIYDLEVENEDLTQEIDQLKGDS